MFSSCEEDVQTNNPTIQGKLDNVFWRAIDVKATVATNGSVTITGLVRDQELVLKIPSRNPGIHTLGTHANRVANYTLSFDNEDLFYTTGVNIGGVGEIKVIEYNQASNTITGEFRFNAVNIHNNPIGGEYLNFNEGVFYNVPVTGFDE